MLGQLYVVATPIGNLGDMVPRAVEVLKAVDCIAAEDTRHSLPLLRHFDIDTQLIAYHDYSDDKATESVLTRLKEGQDIALISDAGTPLICDPGYRLVSKAKAEGIKVTPIPGSCAFIAALSAAGLPTDRFVFEGFLPAKQAARLKRLESLLDESRTLVFYEAPHRILAVLTDMVEVFGPGREACIAREITKKFETIEKGSLSHLLSFAKSDSDQQRGEFVIMIGGKPAEVNELDAKAQSVAGLLAKELPPKKAAGIAAEITGCDKKAIYQWLVESK